MAAAARAYFDLPSRPSSTSRRPRCSPGSSRRPSRLDPFHHPEAAKAATRRGARAHGARKAHRRADARRGRRRADRARAVRTPSYGTRVGLVHRGGPPARRRRVPGATRARRARDRDRGAARARHAAAADAVAHAESWTPASTRRRSPRSSGITAPATSRRSSAAARGARDKFDRMLQSCRQPGSAWKPIVYGAALETRRDHAGHRAARRADRRVRRGHEHALEAEVGQSRSAASCSRRMHSPRRSTRPRSTCSIASGADGVIAFARRLGITTQLAEVRPMALGASCVKPIELARAYAVIARRGWAVAPRLAVRVRRGDDVLFDATVPEDPWLDPARRFDRIAATAGRDPAERVSADGGQLIDEPIAFQLDDMMRAVVERGTAAADERSAGPPRARPARRTTTPTRGSSASPAARSPRCGSASTIRRRSSATRAMARTPHCRCGCARCARPKAIARSSPLPGDAAARHGAASTIDRETGCSPHRAPGSRCGFVTALHRQRSRANSGHRPRISARTSREF